MDLTEKILFYMKRYHMIPENKNIVVGLSGGADSVCRARSCKSTAT